MNIYTTMCDCSDLKQNVSETGVFTLVKVGFGGKKVKRAKVVEDGAAVFAGGLIYDWGIKPMNLGGEMEKLVKVGTQTVGLALADMIMKRKISPEKLMMDVVALLAASYGMDMLDNVRY